METRQWGGVRSGPLRWLCIGITWKAFKMPTSTCMHGLKPRHSHFLGCLVGAGNFSQREINKNALISSSEYVKEVEANQSGNVLEVMGWEGRVNKTL